MRYKYVQIAAEANVSLATVSRVMRGLKGPSAHTRARVLATANEIGYFPAVLNPKLEMLILSRERTSMPLKADPFYALVLAGIEERATRLKLKLTLTRWPDELNPYGVLYIGRADPIQLAKLHSQAIPTVLLDDEDERFDCVVSQNEMGAQKAVQHLLAVTHSQSGIALVTGHPAHYSFALRRKGAIAALVKAGRFREELVFDSYTQLESTLEADFEAQRRGGYAAARWLVERIHEVGGVLVHNDLTALAMIEELRRLGVHIPEDLKVVGFDDEIGAIEAPIPLSTVRVDHRSMGAWAVDLLLLRLMDLQRPTAQVVVGTTLISRASSGFT